LVQEKCRKRQDSWRLAMSLEPPQSVEKLQTALHAKAKAAPGYRFYLLHDKLYRWDVLAHAYERCKANKGAAGVDGQTFTDIEALGERGWLEALAKELKDKTYQAAPVKRVWIPKADGKQRPLGIPTIRDRVVQMAAVLVLEPIFEADLQPEQHAYRSGVGALDAIKKVQGLLDAGYTDVVDADLSGYFDSIPHHELMKCVARRLSDRHLLHLVKMWLVAPVEETDEKGRKQRTTRNKDEGRGTPLDATGPRGPAASARRQLCGRLRDLHAWPSRRGDGDDAGHDGQAEADGERAEDAAVSPAGRNVHVLGLHVRSSLLASVGRGLPGSAARAEESPAAVPGSERVDGSPHESGRSRGESQKAQPEAEWLGQLLLPWSRGPGLRSGDETRAT
jgi:hypothetical protein